jgi:hypothetical protein
LSEACYFFAKDKSTSNFFTRFNPSAQVGALGLTNLADGTYTAKVTIKDDNDTLITLSSTNITYNISTPTLIIANNKTDQ